MKNSKFASPDSVLRGSKFGQGFLAAGVSDLASPYAPSLGPGADVVAVAVVGGTTSVLGGGKFANGAVTAAFGYLYNELSHRYFYERHICYTLEPGCTAENAFEGLRRGAYPGQDPDFRLPDDGGRFYVLGVKEFAGYTAPIEVIVDAANLTITNRTLEGHIFCCGTVQRSIIVRRSFFGLGPREIVVRTEGLGTNSDRLNWFLNQAAGFGGFWYEDQIVTSYVRQQQLEAVFSGQSR